MRAMFFNPVRRDDKYKQDEILARVAARALAERIDEALHRKRKIETWAPIVIEMCRGIGPLTWRAYDDAGGNAAPWVGKNFYKVRQVRNHPEWGHKLSDAIGK